MSCCLLEVDDISSYIGCGIIVILLFVCLFLFLFLMHTYHTNTLVMDVVRIAVNKDSVTAIPAQTPILVQDVFSVLVVESFKSKEK